MLYMDRDEDGFVSLDDLRLEFVGELDLSPGIFSAGTITFLVGTTGDDIDTSTPLGSNDDLAFGLAGDDFLNGLAGSDRLSGDSGNDVLWGEDAGQSLLQPDLTLWFDLPAAVAAQRRAAARTADRLEQEDLAFFDRVRAGYASRAAADPLRIVRINADQPREAVWADVARAALGAGAAGQGG